MDEEYIVITSYYDGDSENQTDDVIRIFKTQEETIEYLEGIKRTSAYSKVYKGKEIKIRVALEE